MTNVEDGDDVNVEPMGGGQERERERERERCSIPLSSVSAVRRPAATLTEPAGAVLDLTGEELRWTLRVRPAAREEEEEKDF